MSEKQAIVQTAQIYAPWCSPEHAGLRDFAELDFDATQLTSIRETCLAAGVPESRLEPGFHKRMIEMTGSDDTLDRYNSRILVDGKLGEREFGGGWQLANFVKNPVFMPVHEYKEFPIGQSVKVYSDAVGRGRNQVKRLRFVILFADETENPLAERVLRLYRGKFLRASSVGFSPKKAAYFAASDEESTELGLPLGEEQWPRPRLLPENELLELSAVPIPGNPNVVEGAPRPSPVLTEDESAGLSRFADETADVAPELAYEVRSLAPSRRLTVDLTGGRLPNGETIPEAWGLSGYVRIQPKAAAAEFVPLPAYLGEGLELSGTLWESSLAAASSLFPLLDGVSDDEALTVRWNPELPRAFDVTEVKYEADTAEHALVSSYLECDIKRIRRSESFVSSARLGSFLSALEDVLAASWKVHDVRNLDSAGREAPPLHETIQLNSTASRTFLVHGTRFASTLPESDLSISMAVRVAPRYWGLNVTTYVKNENAVAAERFVSDAWTRARELNFLKGEAFSLSGRFLERGSETWDDLFLSDKNENALNRMAAVVLSKGDEMKSRGALLLGPPGTGKTLAGRVLMNVLPDSTFIWMAARDFWYSGAVGGLVHAFDLARECAPATLFIEDIDSWLSDHAIDILKTEMDGVAKSNGVLTVLTTNFPELLPEALLDRPGRFHDVLKFELPDEAVRVRMLARWLPVLDAAALAKAAKATAGWSGAHVRELTDFAEIIAEQDQIPLARALDEALAKVADQKKVAEQAKGGRGRRGAETHVHPAVLRALTSREDLVRLDDGEYERLESEDRIVPKNVSSEIVADKAEAWKAPTLADFTDKAWDDLSDAEKNRIAGHFAYADAAPPSSFGALKLGHHRPSDGRIVFRGVIAAIGRLNQTGLPENAVSAVRAHLNGERARFQEEDDIGDLEIAAWKFLDDREAFEIQTLIFPKRYWTLDRARSWLDEHELRSDKVDETVVSFRFRQKSPADFVRLKTTCMMPGGTEPDDEACRIKAVGGPMREAVEFAKSREDELIGAIRTSATALDQIQALFFQIDGKLEKISDAVGANAPVRTPEPKDAPPGGGAEVRGSNGSDVWGEMLDIASDVNDKLKNARQKG